MPAPARPRTTTPLAIALAAALLTASAGGAREASACPAFSLTAAPLGGQVELAPDGGLLIVQVRDQGPASSGLTVALDGVAAAYDADYLAPGLERWRPRGAAAGARVTVTVGTAATTMKVAAAGARLRAPAIRAARSTTARPRAPLRYPGAPFTELTIELARPLPAGAVALVVFGKRPADGGIAWAPVTPGATRFSIMGGGKGCGGGAGPIYVRDRVSFAWVDARGRISARTPARTVTLTPPDAADAADD